MSRRIVAAVIVVLAAAVPYLSALHNYFVGDDFGLVPYLAAQPFSHFFRFFVESWAPDVYGAPLDELRPFPALTYQIGSALDSGATAHHAISIALHALTAVLVMLLASRAARVSPAAAAFGGVAFALMPLHTESVAWITARAEVVYTPLFLLSLLAWARWRQSGRAAFYAAALVCLFAALFSKQNAMVMVAVFALYDLLVERLPLRQVATIQWRWYVPVVLVTMLYLLVRYAVFSDVMRTSQLDLPTIGWFAVYQAMYVVMLLSGHTVIVREAFLAPVVIAVVVGSLGALCLAVLLRDGGTDQRPHFAQRGPLFIFFGPAWWALTTLPMIVAGYATSRHLYLALAGIAVLLALTMDVLWRSPRRFVRAAGTFAAMMLMLFWVVQQQRALTDWNTAARLSQQMVHELELAAAAEPPGTLLLLDAPAVYVAPSTSAGRAIGRPWIWSWAFPYTARPPYTRSDLFERVRIVSTLPPYCCAGQWTQSVRREVTRWMEDPGASVRAIHWDARTGAMRSWSGGSLPDQARRLGQAGDETAMTSVLQEIFGSP